jgi:hypothetical protein
MYTVFFIFFIISSTCFGCYLHQSSAAQLQHTAIGCVWFGVLLHWSRYWFGTAVQLSTVSYSTAIGCVWFGVLLHWSRDWFGTYATSSSRPCTKLTLHCNHRSGHLKTEHTGTLLLLQRHLGNWPRGKHEKQTAGSA